MSKNNHALFGGAALAFTAILWLRLLLGVSFLATPAKFAAPTLTLPVALDIGRVTFALLSKVEWTMAALVTASMILAGWRPVPLLLSAVLIGLLALQSVWLLPILDACIASVIASTPLPPTNHHLVYLAVELSKAILLLALAADSLRQSYRAASERVPAAAVLAGERPMSGAALFPLKRNI